MLACSNNTVGNVSGGEVDTGDIKSVWPDAKEIKRLGFNYAHFAVSGEKVTATAMPPYLKKPVKLLVLASPKGYEITSATDKCESAVAVSADGTVIGMLPPGTMTDPIHVDATENKEISILIPDTKANNYNCGITVRPVR